MQTENSWNALSTSSHLPWSVNPGEKRQQFPKIKNPLQISWDPFSRLLKSLPVGVFSTIYSQWSADTLMWTAEWVLGMYLMRKVEGANQCLHLSLVFSQLKGQSQQRCSSDLRAALEQRQNNTNSTKLYIYIYICLRGHSLQDTSDVQNKERLFLSVIYEVS